MTLKTSIVKRWRGVVACVALVTVTQTAGAQEAETKPGPLKVFILAGQSNMDGQADKRTIDFLGEDKDPARAALLKLFKPDGKNFMTRDDVWVANAGVYDNLQTGFGGRKNYDKLGNCIGPEYAFGYYMGEAFKEQVLLIKYGPGGQSLYANFRPPSAGKTGNPQLDDAVLSKEVADKWNEGRQEPVVGLQYRALVRYIHATLKDLKQRFPAYDEKAGYEIVGLVWFQGYNDMFDANARKQYGPNLVHLIKDLRTEFKSPNMKVVVGVMGVNGVNNEVGKQKEVRDGHRFVNTVPEFKGNVKAIETAPLLHPDVVELKTAGWLNKRDMKAQPITPEEQAMLQRATSNQGFHYYGEGRFFILLGKGFAETMLELMNSK
jgi:alpha-galactosidase